MTNPHHENEWNKPPECNPGAQDQHIEQQISEKLKENTDKLITDYMRLLPDHPKKLEAIDHLRQALRVAQEICSEVGNGGK